MGNSGGIQCMVCGYKIETRDALEMILKSEFAAKPTVEELTAAEANRRQLPCPKCGAKGRWRAC